MKTPERPLRERFEEGVERAEGGCWKWTGETNAEGEGILASDHGEGHPLLAHHVSYHLYVGPIPVGFRVDRVCSEPLCVNPGHLAAVPPERPVGMPLDPRGRHRVVLAFGTPLPSLEDAA